jgi:hypothetical protein
VGWDRGLRNGIANEELGVERNVGGTRHAKSGITLG